MSASVSTTAATPRAALLTAAESLFAEKGYANTQIAEIAEAAGVGIGSFYRQFEDKEAVLSTILQELFRDLREELVATRRGIESRSPLEQVLTIQRAYDTVFRVFARRPDVTMTMLRSGYGMSPTVEQIVWDGIDGLVQDMVADLERGEAVGFVKVEPKRNFADAVVGMVVQLTHRMLVDGSPAPSEAAEFCTRMTVGGMLVFMPPELVQAYAPLLTAFPAPATDGGET